MTSSYLTLAEVAEMLRRSPKAARRWLRVARVPLLHLGEREFLVPAGEFDAARERATRVDPPRIVLPPADVRAVARGFGGRR